MIDHVSIAVRDLTASGSFYDAVLAPLGLVRLVTRAGTIGYGKRYPEFWLNARPGMTATGDDSGTHICLRAPDSSAVQAFHTIAVARGGRSDGMPGPRQAAMIAYFGAFIRDLDGNKIEAATFPKE